MEWTRGRLATTTLFVLAGCFGNPPGLGRPLAQHEDGSTGHVGATTGGGPHGTLDAGSPDESASATGGPGTGPSGTGPSGTGPSGTDAAGSADTGSSTAGGTTGTSTPEDSGADATSSHGDTTTLLSTGGEPDFGCIDGDLGDALGDVSMGETVGLGDDYGPTCVNNSAGDLQLLWAAPAAGSYTFSLGDSHYDTVLAVRSPDCGGEEIGCNDDMARIKIQSEITDIDLMAGETVIVAVDGYFGNTGEYTLTITAQ